MNTPSHPANERYSQHPAPGRADGDRSRGRIASSAPASAAIPSNRWVLRTRGSAAHRGTDFSWAPPRPEIRSANFGSGASSPRSHCVGASRDHVRKRRKARARRSPSRCSRRGLPSSDRGRCPDEAPAHNHPRKGRSLPVVRRSIGSIGARARGTGAHRSRRAGARRTKPGAKEKPRQTTISASVANRWRHTLRATGPSRWRWRR